MIGLDELGAMSRPTLVVIVTYNSLELLGPLIRAVDMWLGQATSHRLAVVDNSNSLESIELVRAETRDHESQVISSVSSDNLGFARGVNLAVSEARVQWGEFHSVLLLNPDVSTTADTLGRVTDLLDDESIGIAAPLLFDGAGNRVDRGVARRFWNRRRLFSEVAGVPRLAVLLGTSHRNLSHVGQSGSTLDVDITSGAFMAIRGSLLGDGLDTRLPMYLEDQEICYRARIDGLRVVVAETVQARHIGGFSRKTNSAMTRQLRMMELAAAPCISLMDTGGCRATELRLIVGIAGIARTLAACAMFIFGILSRSRREWASNQIELGRWFVAWAASGRVFQDTQWRA